MASKKKICRERSDSCSDDSCDTEDEKTKALATRKKRVKYAAKWRSEWRSDFPDFRPSAKSNSHAFCTVCKRDISVSHGGKNDISKHEQSEAHKSCAKPASQGSIGKFFVKAPTFSVDGLEQATTRAEAIMCQLIAQQNLSLSTADVLVQTFKTMFPDSKIAANMKCCRNKTTAMVKELSAMQMSDLASRMKSQPFSISTDGSNDVDKKQFPLVVRIQDNNSGTVNAELLAMRVCEDAATGQNIFNLIDQEFAAQGIPWENCLSLGCDNANVMTGRHKGVIAFVRKETIEVHMSGCCLHLVHLGARQGASCLPPVEDILVDIFYYFKKSVNRQTDFKHLQQLYDVEQRKMLKHVCTRWLSIARCLDRLMMNWVPLLHFFREQKKAVEKGNKESSSTSKVEVISTFLKSPTNRLYCHFLGYTLKVYDKVLKGLQAEEPMIHVLRPNLVELLQDLYSRFLKPDAVIGKPVEEVEFAKRDNQKDDEDLLIGTAAHDMIKDATANHLRSSRIQEFYATVRMYFEKVCDYLLKKLPLDDPVLQRTDVVNPDKQKSAKIDDLRYFLHRFPALVPRGEEKNTIIEQFAKYQFADITSCLQDRVDLTWAQIGKQHHLDVLAKVMMGILCIPHSSAPCERVFSVVRKISTDQRGSLGQDTIEALLVVKGMPGHYLDNSRKLSDTQLSQLKGCYYKSLKK